MMVFLPFLVDQTYVSFFLPGARHEPQHMLLRSRRDGKRLQGLARPTEVLSVNAHKRDLAMAHAQLQEFDKDYAAARLHCRFLTT
jgi:hypothetical protein